MRLTSTATVIAILLAAVQSPPAAADTARENAVRNAVNAFGQAFLQADADKLATLLTTDYIHINGGSGNVLNRDEWLGWVASRREELDRETLVVTDYTIADLKVELDGDTAIVTGVASLSGSRNGDPVASRVRFSNVWLFRDGAWRRAAFHDSPLPEP